MQRRSFWITLPIPNWAAKLLEYDPERAVARALWHARLYRRPGYGAIWTMRFGDMVGVALDWDHTDLNIVHKDIALINTICPDLGQPTIYKTGSGFHVLWPKYFNSFYVEQLYDLFRAMSDMGKVWCCGGHIRYSLRDIKKGLGPNIRVGRKYKHADIQKVEAGEDSPIIRKHDQLVWWYNQHGLLSLFLRRQSQADSKEPVANDDMPF